jgi:hypothetical protein
LLKINEKNYKKSTKNNYLIKPNITQIIALIILIGGLKQTPCSIENHLIEILTGQGKSIILGFLSLLFALMGKEVHCLCYS